jgi:ABC-type nitrate/sulfonate/bicarbonate transport system substrate-binding protein
MLTSLLSSKPTVNIGYLALLDSAPLIIAQEAGFFAEQGINVSLSRENNWASIRDKLMLGMFDAAHLLAPMVIASHISNQNSDDKKTFKTALALGYNGNAISISNELCEQLHCDGEDFQNVLKRLKQHVNQSKKRLTLGTVHAHSMHTYLLHLMLKEAEIQSDQVDIKVIPPIHMVEAMTEGDVDIFCVGEPWNSQAQIQQAGKILCYGSELWTHAPEKVLAVNTRFAEQKTEIHKKVIKAVIQACQWLEEPDHMAQAAIWLSAESYLDCSSDLLLQAMVSQWHIPNRPKKNRKIFYSNHANAPWPSHAKWIESAMHRFGKHSNKNADSFEMSNAYDWQTYLDVLTEMNLKTPLVSDAPPSKEI